MTAPIVLAAFLALPAVAPAVPVPPSPDAMASDAMRSDARLADVRFVGPRQGWAVGDRGVIWHTDDGGRQWRLQTSPTTCPLQSVCFVDERTGWAAGGFAHPYTHTTTGVLLSTRDGGKSWLLHAGPLLPALRQVRFFDARNGWAIGCSSAMYPTGVFRTADGGRSWVPVSGENFGSWLAGDFVDPMTGILGGREGTLAIVQNAGATPARTSSFGLRDLRQMRLADPLHAWLVGDGGLVMTSGDQGVTWQTPPGELPRGATEHFDFAALAVRGSKCWIAGSPGTRVFHTADGGQTWVAFATATTLPIHALAFSDDQHGWAVGALGTILTTADGGRSWQRQRAGGTRAALLAILGEGRDVPLELFARLSGNEGYLGVVEVLGRRDVEVKLRGEAHPADRVHEALVAVGASGADSAWQFPLRQSGLGLGPQKIVDGWDRTNDGRGLQELERRVMREIRLWRPEIIVTHDASPRGDDPLGHLINQIVLQAVERAADPTWLPEQITEAGLEPWEVKKVFAALPHGANGSNDLSTAQLAGRLGHSLAEVASLPRGLLEERFSVGPQTLGFRLLVSKLPEEQGRSDFFAGIALQPGGDARRELGESPAEGLDLLRRTAQRRRNVQAILDKAEKDPRNVAQFLAQTAELTRDLDGDNTAQVLYHLGQRYYRAGRWPLAAETFQSLLDRCGEHPLAAPAAIWLVQYYASGEAAWRLQGGQRVQQGSTVRQASAVAVRQSATLATALAQEEDRPGRAAELGKQIEQSRPSLFANGSLRFPLAAAHRNQGFPRQAERFYLTQSRAATHDAWWACAQGELWLADPKGTPPKPLLRCTAARAKPKLDGRLDDEVWQQARPAPLQSAQHDDAEWPALVSLAYDAEFLYLAVNCRRVPGAKHETAKGPRPRDGDLSAHDRVEVFLDLDRDYATYYRLAIDDRGWTGDDCWGDRTWDPTWYVAVKTSDEAWTAEAAVPLDQLTGQYPTARSVWALGLQRTVPDQGFQSWTTPAAADVVPEGFGYLIFE